MKSPVAAILVLIAFFIPGCAQSGRKFPIERTTEIVRGVSTRADVRRILGKPWSVTDNADGSGFWTYFYCLAHSQVVGVKVTTDSFTVHFDRDGIVTNAIQSSSGHSHSSAGLADTLSAPAITDNATSPPQPKQVTVGRDFPMERAHEIKRGESTTTDVRRIMGEPTTISLTTGNREAWSYGFTRRTPGGPFETKHLTVLFDSTGKVTTITGTKR